MPRRKRRVITSAERKPANRKPVRNSERILKTAKRDLSKMKSIKIDSKTTILVPVGTDIAEAKRKYEQRALINPPRTHISFNR